MQAKQFACHINHDLILFPVYYAYNKNNGGEFIINYNPINIQDSKYGTTVPGLLYYYKKMSYIVLAKVYTPMEIVNGGTTIAYMVTLYPIDMLIILK